MLSADRDVACTTSKSGCPERIRNSSPPVKPVPPTMLAV